jgi:hypothetical protein
MWGDVCWAETVRVCGRSRCLVGQLWLVVVLLCFGAWLVTSSSFRGQGGPSAV